MTAAQLETIRDQAVDNLTAATLTPKPTYSIDGQRFDHAGYVLRLQRLIDWCEERLRDLAPYEIETRAGSP